MTEGAPRHGMSDADLESACEQDFAGFTPWVYWTSELYSLGKCLRIFARYPSFLPLYVYSDHGAGLHSSFFPHELANSSGVYLTFHPLKAERNKELVGKRVIHVPHPWIHYRRSRGIERLRSTTGTLVFLTHHVPGLKWENRSTDEYFESLKSLPEKFQPVVLCLHMHDIVAGFHKELRRFGLPMVTAGHTSSIQFVDRFYDLVKSFSYATSLDWGSQVAYCVELGVPYFFLGDRPRLVNVSHKEMPLGKVSYQDVYHEEYDKKAENLFRQPVDQVTSDQKAFVETVLGLHSPTTRTQVSAIVWGAFFSHWRAWWPSLVKPFFGSLLRHGLVGVLERFRRHL